MLTDLKDIGTLAVNTVSAWLDHSNVAYFADDLIVLDVGDKRNEIEAALTDRGFVVVFDPPAMGRALESSADGGAVSAEVLLYCNVMFNQARNTAADGAGKSPLEAVQNVISAMLQYAGVGGASEDKFFVQDDFFHLIVRDEGILEYVLGFRKWVSFS
jgi:hypothetical protein